MTDLGNARLEPEPDIEPKPKPGLAPVHVIAQFPYGPSYEC